MTLKKYFFLTIVALIIQSTQFLYGQRNFSSPIVDSLVGSKAENFTVMTLDSKIYELRELDKIVVINFWFGACAPCIAEFPDLNELSKKYETNKDVIFLGISVQGTEDFVRKFTRRKEFNYQIVASDFSISNILHVQMYPTNIIIDKKGIIRFAKTGYDPQIFSKMDNMIQIIWEEDK